MSNRDSTPKANSNRDFPSNVNSKSDSIGRDSSRMHAERVKDCADVHDGLQVDPSLARFGWDGRLLAYKEHIVVPDDTCPYVKVCTSICMPVRVRVYIHVSVRVCACGAR